MYKYARFECIRIEHSFIKIRVEVIVLHQYFFFVCSFICFIEIDKNYLKKEIQ